MKKKNIYHRSSRIFRFPSSRKISKNGDEVIGIDNMMGGYADNVPKNIKFHKIDCCDLNKVKELMKGVDIVYHCAATAHEGQFFLHMK